MPLTRYEIRNEYSLADPELYRAADKDDPEALLEGVAMAGLVGVLRQLGDLAEFAAEIFHDLHEELMATAARGHGLTVRVQQIEAELPTIEKAFLSQTSHSSLYYNTGVDWHPNVHMDQNLVTRGDLPRFVMDSYEECRGPPRLFLLDKFDVAGAGSCLKRYTDPSFFKAESPLSVIPNAEVQREKKGRKSKKKGSRWRNGETPEALVTSHVKLQQLFLEERVENHISDPARRVKLKRRPKGSQFESAIGKSYMDVFLKNPTPDPDVAHEVSITSSPVKMTASIAAETRNGGLNVRAICPDKITQQRKRSAYSSSDSEAGHKLYIHDLTEGDNGTSPKFSSNQMDEVPSTQHELDQKEIVVEGARKIEGYQSDDEVETYVDALATMDSEIETDSEYRAKNGMQILNVSGRRMGSDATEEQCDFTHSTDSQSIGNSSLMDGGNLSSGKEKSSFSYSSSFDLAENAPSELNTLSKSAPSPDHCEAEIGSSSSDLHSYNGNPPLSQISVQISPDDACNGNLNISSYKNEDGEPSSSSCLTESGTMISPGDPGGHFTEVSSFGRELDGMSSDHSNAKVGCVNADKDLIYADEHGSCMSNYDDLASQTRGATFTKLSFNSMEEMNNYDIHESHTSLHFPNVVQLASDKESNDDLRNDIIQGEYMEKEHALTSVASPDLSPTRFDSQDFAKPENDTCSPHLEPEGSESEECRSGPMLDNLEIADLEKMQLPKPELDNSLDLGVGFHRIREAKLEETSSSLPNGISIGGFSSGNYLVYRDHDAINLASAVPSLPTSPDAVDASPGDEIEDTIHLQPEDVATSVADASIDDNGGDASSLDPKSTVLVDEHSLILQDLSQNGLYYDEEHHHESSKDEMVDKEADVTSQLESILSKTLSSDCSDLDLAHHVSYLATAASSRNILHVDNDDTVKSSYEDPEEDQSSPTHHHAEISTSPNQQVELCNSQFEGDTWHDQASESFVTKSIGYIPKTQLSESRYSHRSDAIEEDEDAFSSTDHVAERRIPPATNYEGQKDHFDLKTHYDQISPSAFAQYTNFNENDGGSISSTMHHKFEPRDSLELKDESRRDNFIEHCQWEYSDSKSVQQRCIDKRAEDDISPFTHHMVEEVELQKSWHDQSCELKHAPQIEVTESLETAASSDTCSVPELTSPIDQSVKLQVHFDENSRLTVDGYMASTLTPMGESSSLNSYERETDPSTNSSVPYLASQPSLSQFFPQFGVSKPAEDPLKSKFPTFPFLPEAPLDEMPPLPPLPPMQWRSGKVQDNFPPPESNLFAHNLPSVPPLISRTEDEYQSCDPARETYISYSSKPYSSYSSLEDQNSQDKNANPTGPGVHFVDPMSEQVPDLFTSACKLQLPSSGVVLPMDLSVKCEDVPFESGGGNPFSPLTGIEDTPSALPFSYLPEKTVKPLNQSALSMSPTLDAKIQEEPIDSQERTANAQSTITSLPAIQENKKQPLSFISEEHSIWSSSSSVPAAPPEYGMPNGNRQNKLPRPRNPLIDAVVAHDKSKLRKVTQLPQPQVGQQAEERDTLLEQIRAKSFNLKPAAVTRPSIQGPKTNLRVAAILEKANAIRQACAGSDEDDDEDGWSDS